jgi:hypothetical protein
MSLPSDSSPETPGFTATFIIYLDTYTKTTTENNGKAKTKEVKSTKVKELVFQVSESNYIEFLTTILMKHNKSHYRITERKKYTFKYLLGNSRGRVIFVLFIEIKLISQWLFIDVLKQWMSTTKLIMQKWQRNSSLKSLER